MFACLIIPYSNRTKSPFTHQRLRGLEVCLLGQVKSCVSVSPPWCYTERKLCCALENAVTWLGRWLNGLRVLAVKAREPSAITSILVKAMHVWNPGYHEKTARACCPAMLTKTMSFKFRERLYLKITVEGLEGLSSQETGRSSREPRSDYPFQMIGYNHP